MSLLFSTSADYFVVSESLNRMTNITTPDADQIQFQGWVSSPNRRGSFDILWSCSITLILCSWSAVCVNIPARTDNYWKKTKRKLWLTWICLTGPEFIMAIALGQWIAVKQARIKFHASGYTQWTWKHGFYAEMGGFVALTRDDKTFPLCGKSLLYLIDKQLVSEDIVKEIILLDPRAIDDGNKADAPFRLITLAQALWFCINVFARFAQHLPVSTSELSVLAFFFPAATTYMLWWHKPCDIDTIRRVPVNAQHDELCAGQPPWYRTPLDFVDREEWHGSQAYRFWLNILNRINAGRRRRPLLRGPITRRSDNDVLPQPFKYQLLFELLPNIPFFGINFIAWNSHFPTITERSLWRIASMTMIVFFVIAAAIEKGCLYFWPVSKELQKMADRRRELAQYDSRLSSRDGESQPSDSQKPIARSERLAMTWKRQLMKFRNNSPNDDPHLDVPLKIIIPGTLMAAIYCICRAYMYVEDVIAFRRMPVRVYDTVQWSDFLPHFG